MTNDRLKFKMLNAQGARQKEKGRVCLREEFYSSGHLPLVLDLHTVPLFRLLSLFTL